MGSGDERRNEAWVRAGTREEQLRVVKGKEKEDGIDMEECQREVWAMKEEIVICWTRRKRKNNATFVVLPQNKT